MRARLKETLAHRACEARALRACKTLTQPIEKKTDCFAVYTSTLSLAEATQKWPILVIRSEEFKLTNSKAFLESRSKCLNER